MSDKVNGLSVHAERLFIRLIMKVDDYGCFYADPRVLKANLFPLLLDNIREADLLRWMAECQKAGLIVLYEKDSKKYLQILDFRQRLDKARSKFPLPETSEVHRTVNDVPAEDEVRKEPEKEKKDPPNGGAETTVSAVDSQNLFEKLDKNKNSICQFISTYKPVFIEPYRDLWNIFAQEKGLAKVSKIGNARLRKFKIRIREKDFDFIEILKKAAKSEFLLTGAWFGFDWLFENETNYQKVIEGNYVKKSDGEISKIKKETSPASPPKVELPKIQKELNFLFEMFLEGKQGIVNISVEHYDYLKQITGIEFTESQKARVKENAAIEIGEKELSPSSLGTIMKLFAVLQFFQIIKDENPGKKSIF